MNRTTDVAGLSTAGFGGHGQAMFTLARLRSCGFRDLAHGPLTSNVFTPVPAYSAQLRDQERDQKWQLISSVIWWWNTWEWKERREHTWEHKKHDGCFMTGPLALSVTFRGRVSLCYRPPLPGNYHNSTSPALRSPENWAARVGE